MSINIETNNNIINRHTQSPRDPSCGSSLEAQQEEETHQEGDRLVKSSSSSRNSSYDSLLSEASSWSDSTVTSTNSSTVTLSPLHTSHNNNNNNDSIKHNSTSSDPNTHDDDDQPLSFSSATLTSSQKQQQPSATATRSPSFRDRSITTAKLMCPETRLAIIQMALQLSHILPASGHCSMEWNLYASQIADLYSPNNYDSYRVLNQRANVTVHQLNTFQCTPFPEAPVLGSATASSNSHSMVQYSAQVTKWVQDNIVDGIEKSILDNVPFIKKIVSQRLGLAAVAREKIMFSYFWDHPETVRSVLGKTNSSNTCNSNDNAASTENDADSTDSNDDCEYDPTLGMFQCFTCTPRYMFLVNLLRIASAISAKIRESVPEDVYLRLRKYVSKSSSMNSLVKELAETKSDYHRIVDTVPTCLEQYRAFFEAEMVTRPNSHKYHKNKYHRFTSDPKHAGMFGGEGKHKAAADHQEQGSKKDTATARCSYGQYHVDVSCFESLGYSDTHLTTVLNLLPCPGCKSSSNSSAATTTTNYVQDPLVIVLGTQPSFIEFQNLAIRGPTVQVVAEGDGTLAN